MNNSEDTHIQPLHAQNGVFFLGGAEFNANASQTVLGLVSGIKTRVVGQPNCIELRGIIARGGSLSRVMTELMHKHALVCRVEGSPAMSGLGWTLKDEKGWVFGRYYKDIVIVSVSEEARVDCPIVEEVLIIQYQTKVDISAKLEASVITRV